MLLNWQMTVTSYIADISAQLVSPWAFYILL